MKTKQKHWTVKILHYKLTLMILKYKLGIMNNILRTMEIVKTCIMYLIFLYISIITLIVITFKNI